MKYFYEDCNIKCKIKVIKIIDIESVEYKIDLVIWCKITKKRYKKKFYI